MLIVVSTFTGHADDTDSIRCHAIPLDPSSYHGSSSRVRADQTGDIPMLVLVPSDYDTSAARYPVVYLIQGGINRHDCFLGMTDLIDFTAAQAPELQAIVVMPDVTSGPAWAGQSNRDAAESAFIDTLVPYVDAHYRTKPGGPFRSIAGFSAGGLGALDLAARHPDVFGVAASFSGIAEVSEFDPSMEVIGAGASLLITADGVPDPFAQWGDPLTSPMGWHAVNPVDLAPNFGGVSLTLFVGDGTPCDAEDLQPDPVLTFWPPMFWVGDGGLKIQAEHLSDALNEAAVPHVFDTYGCGIHSYRYVQRDIHAWWQPMFESFGRPAPVSFDFRSGDPAFSVWGWTFDADDSRSAEFLHVIDASDSGLTLTGSGIQTIITSGFFAPGQIVVLTGAVEQVVTAGSNGRITFMVDLGLAHEHQQFTPAARALEAAGGYWTSKTVTFEAG